MICDNYKLKVPVDLEGDVCVEYKHGLVETCRDNGKLYQCTRIPLFTGDIEKSKNLIDKCEIRIRLKSSREKEIEQARSETT